MRNRETGRQMKKAVIFSLGCTLAVSSAVYGGEENAALAEIVTEGKSTAGEENAVDVEGTAEESATDVESTAEEESAADVENAAEAAEAVASAELLEIGELKIENRTGQKAEGLRVKKAEEENWGENLLGQEDFTAEEEQVYDLCLTDETGRELLFYNLLLGETEELSLFEEEDRTYVTYRDTASGQEVDMSQYALEAFEEPQTLYTKTRLNVRTLPSTEGEILKTLSMGEEVTAAGVTEDWYLIHSGDGYGYISGEFVTDNEEEAARLIEEARAEEEARAAEAARAAQAQAEAAQSSSNTNKSKTEKKKSEKKKTQEEKKKEETKAPGTKAPETQTPETKAPETQAPETQAPQTEKHEVSRENVPSCDDPDHGSTYITYSDGSVDVVDY